MNDTVDDVREHYRVTGLTECLKAAFADFAPGAAKGKAAAPGEVA